jgi:hypothetical protein
LKVKSHPDRALVSAFVAISLAASLVLAALPLSDSLGIVALAFGLLVAALCARKSSAVAGALFTAFALRAALALFYTYHPGFGNPDPDVDGYGAFASHLVTLGFAGVTNDLARVTPGAHLYGWLVAFLYVLLGQSAAMIRDLNALLGLLIVWETYRTALELWHDNVAARRAAWTAAIFPNLIRFSASFPNREAVIVCFLTLSGLYLVRWYNRNRARYLVASFAAIVGASAFHIGIAAGGLVLLACAAGRVLSGGRRLARGWIPLSTVSTAIAILLMLAMAGFAISRGWGRDKMQLLAAVNGEQAMRLSTVALDPTMVGKLTKHAAFGRAVYLANLHMNTPADLVWQVPLRVVFFLLMPFPWYVRNAMDVLGVVDASLYAWLLVGLYRQRRELLSNPGARALVLIAAILVAVFAAVTSNYGTAIRHRAKFAPLLIALAAPGLPWLAFKREPEPQAQRAA